MPAGCVIVMSPVLGLISIDAISGVVGTSIENVPSLFAALAKKPMKGVLFVPPCSVVA